MKIGVVGTCQAPGIGIGLQQLLPDDQVIAIEGTAARRENYLNEAAAKLHECPIVFGHHLADDFGPLSTAAMRHKHRNFHLVPNIAFTGFHPDCIYINDGNRVYQSPMQDYHSAIAAAAFALGLDARAALQLFNENVYRRLGYFEEFTTARAYLAKIMAEAGYNISMEWSHWMARAPFMHSINHPKAFVLAGIAKLMASKAMLIGYTQSFVEPVHDTLSIDPVWPVYPELAAALNLEGSRLFKLNGGPDFATGQGVFMILPDFVEGSYAAYDTYPAAAFKVPAVERVRQVIQDLL
jgi:hypothetical protein